MAERFKVDICTRAGCVHLKQTDCSLNGLAIHRFIDTMQYFQSSKTCQIRKQINLFKTEILIENK